MFNVVKNFTNKGTQGKSRIGVLFYFYFLFSVLCWIVWLIALAISQHKSYNRPLSPYFYHSSGRHIYSFVWWSLWYQLIVYGLVHSHNFSSWITPSLCNDLIVVALIQDIIITDRYIYSYYGSEKTMGVGALLVSIADFLWLFNLSTNEARKINNATDVEKGYNTTTNNVNEGAYNNTLDNNTYVGGNTTAGTTDAYNVNNGNSHYGDKVSSISDTHNTHSTVVQEPPAAVTHQ